MKMGKKGDFEYPMQIYCQKKQVNINEYKYVYTLIGARLSPKGTLHCQCIFSINTDKLPF